MLLDWLKDRDAVCPICGYNLRALTLARCPECSTGLKLGLEAENAIWGPWALASVSFALGLGFDAVVSTLLMSAFLWNPPAPLMWPPVLALIGGFVILTLGSGVGLVAVLTRRRAWMRRRRPVQWRRAAAIFTLVGLIHAAFGTFVASRLW
jgi:hypothetical protein